MKSEEQKEQEEGEEKSPQKSQRLILEHTIEEALPQLERSTQGLLLSGLSAGMDIGFSVLLMAIVLSLFHGVFPEPVVLVLEASMYSVGFIFVILGRSELFTEHTALAVLPVLRGLAPVNSLLRLWGLVYISNIVGGVIFALVLTYLAGPLQFLKPWALLDIGSSLLNHSWEVMLISGILAGWMMGLLAWLLAATRDTISQIVIIWLVTTSIGLAGLHHCIVGNVEVLAALFTNDQFSIFDYLRFLGLATLGNILGGAVFVALLKYSHSKRSEKQEEKVKAQ